jgi:hypothetical protein
MSHDNSINVTVNYTGNEPFREQVRGNPPFHQIKMAAMRAFGLEPAAAGKYVLQYDGTDLDDKRHIDSLGKENVTLVLTLKEEPVKG